MNNSVQLCKLLLCLLYIRSYQSSLTFRIIQSSILHFIPSIKLHHIVLLSDDPKRYLYTLDFTPINQTQTSTLVKMLFAKNVPAEIRLRYIYTNMQNIDNIIQQWDYMNQVNEESSMKLTNKFYNNIKNKQIKNIIASSFEWQPYMNLYNHNCQHFSHYVKNITFNYDK